MDLNKNVKCKSIVWKYFTKNKDMRATCTLCNKMLKHGGNTTNLKHHLQRKHTFHLQCDNLSKNHETSVCENNNPKDKHTNKTISDETGNIRKNKIYEEGGNAIDSSNCSSVSSSIIKRKRESLFNMCPERIEDAFERINSFRDGGTMACNVTDAIAHMIAKDNLSLSIVENEGFKYFMKTVAPLYNIPSRKAITRLLDAKYEVLKKKFINNIQHASSFTLTCDIWTDISNKSYLGITIHYLKTEVTLTKGIIGVVPLEQNHTSEYIKDELLSVLRNFTINQSDIMAVVTNSAPNMINSINSIFSARKHIPCMAHILAHIVPDSLKHTPQIEEIIKKVKNIVTLVRRSVVATDELVRLQKRDGKTDGTILKFKQDVPTRWNSTFYMIERFLQLREYIYLVILKCSTSPEMITHEEFDILHDVVNILQPVELVTKEIGGDLYPTCSIIIPIIRCMTKIINDCIPSTHHGASLKQSILLEIERRFCNIERYQILAISTILDPRFKKIHFQRPMYVSSAINHINTLMQTIADDNSKLVNDMSAISSDVKNNKDKNLWNFHDNLVTLSTTALDEPSGINIELRQYLNQSVIPRHHDPLKYWQILKNAYPTLFKIAKQYLAVVATSVPSERMFSKAGLIKTDMRNRLSPAKLNVLLFLQSLDYEDWKLT